MPEWVLLDVVAQMCADRPTGADMRDALSLCEQGGWVLGHRDELTGCSWSLTEAGTHRAMKL